MSSRLCDDITPDIAFIINGAREWKKSKGFTPPTLFCGHRGRKWVHYHFSQQLRERAPDYKITPHQIRHMAGTLMAEGNLSADIIQVGLAHDDRSSSEVYIDKTKAMRMTALNVISEALGNVKKLSKTCKDFDKSSDYPTFLVAIQKDGKRIATCPCCGTNSLIEKKLKTEQPKRKQ